MNHPLLITPPQEFRDAGDTPTLNKLAERLVQNVVGATETTGGMLVGALIILGQRGDVLERIRAEQAEVMAKFGDEISWDVLGQCTYLDAAVREMLRAVPPAHGLFRRAKQDIQVGSGAGYGTHIGVAVKLHQRYHTALLH